MKQAYQEEYDVLVVALFLEVFWCLRVLCAVCAAFEKLKREAEIEDAKKTELWSEVCTSTPLHFGTHLILQTFMWCSCTGQNLLRTGSMTGTSCVTVQSVGCR